MLISISTKYICICFKHLFQKRFKIRYGSGRSQVENHKDIWSGKGNICLGDTCNLIYSKVHNSYWNNGFSHFGHRQSRICCKVIWYSNNLLIQKSGFGNVNMRNVTSGSKQESTLSNTVITKSVYFVSKERCQGYI